MSQALCSNHSVCYLIYFNTHPKAIKWELDKETQDQKSKVTAHGHQ